MALDENQQPDRRRYVVAYYNWYPDNANDAAGFNQIQRGASAGGNKGDIGVYDVCGCTLAKWANLSANVGLHV